MNNGIKIKHTVKDSVFADLFQDKKYLVQLYKALHHGENIHITENDITDVTLKKILTDTMYNDLGFMIGNKLIILVEVQSTWTVNIIVRALMYLVQSYQEYITRNDMNVYGSKKLIIPEPELYVIYTGEKKIEKEYITLSEEFFEGRKTALNVTVKVVCDGQNGDIINQYITFTKIYGEQYKEYGNTVKAIEETIRICKDRDVLEHYLSEREQEVVSIMLAMFDDETIRRTYERSIRRESLEEGIKQGKEEGIKQGKEEGIKQGKEEGIKQGIKETLLASLKSIMGNLSLPFEQAAAVLGIPAEEQAEYAEMIK